MRTRQNPVSRDGTGPRGPMPPPARTMTRPPSQLQSPSAGVLPPLAAPRIDPEATHDIEIGKIFTNMRLAQKVSRETIARRLATTVFTVEAFETGALAALPHWREAERIVRGYCDLVQLDPKPVLWRLEQHYHPSGLPLSLLLSTSRHPENNPGWQGAAAVPAEAEDQIPRSLRRGPRAPAPVSQPSPRRRRRRRRALLAWTAPVVVVAAGIFLAQSAPGPLYSGVSMLPETVAYPMRASLDALVQAMAPVRDGLSWVDVGDPQLRKADKLQTRQQRP